MHFRHSHQIVICVLPSFHLKWSFSLPSAFQKSLFLYVTVCVCVCPVLQKPDRVNSPERHDRHHFTCTLVVATVTAAIETISQEPGVFLFILSVIKQSVHSVVDCSTFA